MNKFYDDIMAIIMSLAEGDPSPDSVEGKILIRLVEAVEAYERGRNVEKD